MTSRTRTSGALTTNLISEDWFSSDKVACQGNLVRTNRGPYTVSDAVGERRYMSDEIVPNFRKRVANGEVFMNRMFATKTTLTPALFGGTLTFLGNYLQCTGANQYQSVYELGTAYPLLNNGAAFAPFNGTWGPGTALSQGELENAIDEASTRCHSERGRAPVNFWETLAERKQTYALLASYLDSAKAITKGLYLDVVDKRRGSPYRKLLTAGNLVAKGAAGGWLITRYGLLPVLSDIQKLRMQLSKDLETAERHTARGNAVVGRSQVASISSVLSSHIREVGSTLLTDEMVVRAMSLDEWKLTLADHFGLGSKDLATLPWELLTLSFVADWFVNLGDYVGALVPLPGVTQRGCCISYTRTRSYTVTISGYEPIGIAKIVSSATMSKTGTHIEKVRIPGLRAPSIVKLNRSRIDPELDANRLRMTDACALIAQMLSRVSFHLLRQYPSKS